MKAVTIYKAVMGVIGFALGVLVGSIVMRALKLEGRKAAAYIGLISLIGVALTFVNMTLGCTSINNKVGRIGVERNFSWTEKCNEDCECKGAGIFPVCSVSGKAYFNPCVAGCRNMTVVDKMAFRFNFTECDCIDNGTTVTRDFCVDDCGPMLTAYFVISVVGGLIAGSAVIPSILVVLRSVPPQLRSVALGFSGFSISLLSTLPSPIIYGAIVDSACVLWDSKCGGDKLGSCVLYDPDKLRLRMFGFQGILRVCALVFDVVVWYYATGLRLMEGVEEQEEAARHVTRRGSSFREPAKDGPEALEREAEKLGSLTNLSHQPITT